MHYADLAFLFAPYTGEVRNAQPGLHNPGGSSDDHFTLDGPFDRSEGFAQELFARYAPPTTMRTATRATFATLRRRNDARGSTINSHARPDHKSGGQEVRLAGLINNRAGLAARLLAGC